MLYANKLVSRCRGGIQALIGSSLIISGSVMASVVGEVQWIRDGRDGINNLQCTQGMVTSPDQRFTYSISYCDRAINIFSRDQQSGQLNFLDDVVFNEETGEGIRPRKIILMTPDGKFVYVVGNAGEPGIEEYPYGPAIFAYKRDQDTGLLTHVHSYRGEGLTSVLNAHVSNDGKNLYVFDNQTSSIAGFKIAANGFISEQQFIEELSPTGRTYTFPDVVFSNDDKYLYIATKIDSANALITYSRNAETGELNYVSEVTSDDNSMAGMGWADSLALSSDGKHLYAFMEYREEEETLWHFNVDNAGTLSFGGKYAAPENQIISKFYCAGGLTLSKNDRLLYFIDDCGRNLQIWSADETDGGLTFLGAQEDEVNNRDIFLQVDGVEITQDQRYMYLENTYGIAVLDLSADTHIDMTAPSAVQPGSEFQVEMEVTNLGVSSAHGIRTEMELPVGVELISSHPFSSTTECAQVDQAVVCRIPGLENGEAEVIKVQLRADDETSAIEFEASLSQYQVDPDASNSRDSVRIERSGSTDGNGESTDDNSNSDNDNTAGNGGQADSAESDGDSSGGGGSTGLGFLLMLAAVMFVRRSGSVNR